MLDCNIKGMNFKPKTSNYLLDTRFNLNMSV